MFKKILVFGASGKTGLQIIESLKAAKLNFSLYVREQSVDKLGSNQYQIIQGDVLDAQAVNDTIGNHDFTDVIISLGSKALKKTEIRAKGTRNIVLALESNHKSARLHIVSALGVGESVSQLSWLNKLFVKFLLKDVMLDHEEQEKIVKQSSLSYHIIRPVGLKDGPSKGAVHVQAKGHLPKSTIQRADVANFLVDNLVENKEGVSSICQGG